MKQIIVYALLLCSLNNYSQNVGIGATSPAAKLEVKSDGNTNATSALLLKNSDNAQLLTVNSTGSTTLGSVVVPAPAHILGIYNGSNITRAHVGLYATGTLPTTVGAVNRISFSNLSNTTRRFELQSFSGGDDASNFISFKYVNATSFPGVESNVLTMYSSGLASFNGPLSAPIISGGQISTSNLTVHGGSAYDYLMKDPAGHTTYKKATGAVALNYIICTGGTTPATGGATASNNALLGEVRMYAGTVAPSGWMFCYGQLLPIVSYPALFNIIGTNYGGNGSTTFALPDMKGATAVQAGTSVAGYIWEIGETSY